MEEAFWLKKWLNNEIGFHQEDYNPMLVKYWQDITNNRPGDVFVPLCGKTLDMKFLHEKEHKVYGCEISRIAVESFFSENKIKATKINELYTGDNYSIYCKDILALDPRTLKNIDYIYDRASLVALPETIREQYVEWINQFHNGVKVLLISFDFNNNKVGPPFSIPKERVEKYFSKHFYIEVLEDVGVPVDKMGVHPGEIESARIQCYKLIKK